jgi:hypothetical protein
VAAKNNQMAAEQPVCIERPYDVGRKPRNSIHSRSDTELGLARDLFTDRFDPLIEIAFGLSFLSLGRARAERTITAGAVGNADEIVVPSDLLPVQSAAKRLTFSLKLDNMFVKLCSIDSDSALVGCEFLEFQAMFSFQIQPMTV